MLNRRTLISGAAAMAGAAVAPPVLAQPKPVVIRYGYILPPVAQMASVFLNKPELLKNHGKTYTFEAKYFRGSPLTVTALAADEIDVCTLGNSSFPQAVFNAGMADLKIIGDEAEDGLNNQAASEFRVRNDSGINTIADLKGKVIATIAIGSGADFVTRYTLRKVAGLELNRDYTYLETPFPTMKGLLMDKKVDAAFFALPFAMDPEVLEQTKVLYSSKTSLGGAMLNFLVAKGGFIAKNRAAMVDWMEDYVRVIRWYYDPKNRDEAIKAVSEASKIPETTLRRYIFTKDDNYRSLDYLPDLKVLQNNWAALKEIGLLKQDLNTNDYADLSLAKEAVARIK